MREFEFTQSQVFNHPLAEVFPFFADVHNLSAITPPWIGFTVITPAPVLMRQGALIDFRIRLHGIPLRWQTEITLWDPPYRFIDEQRTGPYRRWIHTHTFEEQNGRTQMTDHVRYASFGGMVINKLYLAAEIKRIFSFRKRTLERIFA